MRNGGWVVVVFEGEHKQFDGEVAYVKGPFELYEDANDWSENATDQSGRPIGECQITFIETAEAKVAA